MKSTLAAALIAHSIVFYPGLSCIMFNMDQGAGQENIRKVRFILENLPPWLNFLPTKKAVTKTYIELSNDSRVAVIYPSTIKSPEQLSRSLTIPILYVDEIAFIRHMDKIWTAALNARNI